MNVFIQPLVWVLIFYIPPAIIFLWLVRTQRVHKAHARQPFTEQPLRLAGESTREKADQLFNKAFEDLLVILLGCPIMGLIIAVVPNPNRVVTGCVVLILAGLTSLLVGRRSINRLRESWDYSLGARGEQVVGRELDRLIAQGYRVFHDVPFEGWNVDHVVVGPRGVFAIETKAWRKPAKSRNLTAEIILEGDTLILPGGVADCRAIQQAARNAETLTKWIAATTAEQISVIPVVALPGWSLALKRYGDVAVYSATNMSEHLPKRGKIPLTPEQIQRISFQLTIRCSLGATDGDGGGLGTI